MSFKSVSHGQWEAFVAAKTKSLGNPLITAVLKNLILIPSGLPDDGDSKIYDGALRFDADFAPSSLISVIDGDLEINGKLSTHIDGWDGNTTLIIFGNLTCHSIDHDWASILVVTGDVVVRDWVFASREDSTLVVGGDFSATIFVGADIWAAVGGQVNMEYGYGYAVPIRAHADPIDAPRLLPRQGGRALMLKLGFPLQSVRSEDDVLEALETRLYETGTLLPASDPF